MSKFQFMQGLYANLPERSTEGAIYFTTDGLIKLGIADGAYKTYGNFEEVANISARPESADPLMLYYAKDENCLCRYDAVKKVWVQLNPDTNTTYTLQAGSKNGTVKLVGSDGKSFEIAVTGLGSAAYTESSAYAPATHEHSMDDVTGLKEAVADAKKAGTDAKSAVGTLDKKVGTIPTEAQVETVIDYVNKKTEGIASDSALKEMGAKVQANTDAITKLNGGKEVEGSVNKKIDTAITALDLDNTYEKKGAKDAAIEANKQAAAKVQGEVDTLNGTDKGKSVRTIANEELAAQLIPEGAKEAMNTLQEIAAWIQAHPDDAAAINKKIADLTTLVGTLPDEATSNTVVAYIKEYCDTAIKALNIGDYATVAALNEAVQRITTLEGKSHEHANKALLDTYTQTESNLADAVAKKHEHANAEELAKIAAGDKAKWDAAEQNAKSYADGLASNYDAAGSAETAKNEAKEFATAEVNKAMEWGTF